MSTMPGTWSKRCAKRINAKHTMTRIACYLALLLSAGAFAPAAQALPPAEAVHHIEISNFAFAPPRIEVHAGDTVAFTNRDFAPHTAMADSAAWDTGLLKKDASGQIVVSGSGSLAYHCTFHPEMKGVIVIVASPDAP
jgi:plastocyanin